MLLSLVLTLKPTKDCNLPLTTGNFAHACFLNLVSRADDALAEDLHEQRRDKPFTISPLQGEFTNQRGRLSLKAGKEYWLRITSLEDTLSNLLLDLAKKPPKSLVLKEEEFEIKRMTASSDEAGWACAATYEELYNFRIPVPWPLDYRIRMKFYSPTTFRSNGQNIPLPLPNLVFFGLAQKWNRFSPIDLGSDISKIAAGRLTLSRYDLATKMLDFGKYRQVGFVGEAEFTIKRERDDLLPRVLHLLADFAFYAGVGYKTTMGMGQVRRIG